MIGSATSYLTVIPRAVLQGDTQHGRGIQMKQSPHLHSLNQQNFVEEPGTVLSAEDTATGQGNRQ